MRVSDRMRLSSASAAQAGLATRLDNASRIAASGVRVQKPSDDPSAYATKVRTDHSLAMIDARSQIATKVSGELDVAQSALSTGVDLLASAREAAVSGSNDTLDAGARKLLGQQVSSLRDEMMAVANTKYGTKYLFGGSKTDTAPFDPSGAFVGNDVVTSVPLMDGITPPSNVSGAAIFTSASGGRDILADLQTLADALNSNDVTGIRASLDNIDASSAQLVTGETDAGLASERFKSAIDVMTTTKTAVTAARESEVNGDPMQQLTELSLAKTAYEQGVAITRQMLSVTSLASS